MSTVIEAKNISLNLGSKPTLEDVTFSIDSGDYVGLIGPNGAGKTTLIKLILGIHKPDSGSIKVSSEHTIGYTPQSFSLSHVAPVSVREVLQMTRKQSKEELDEVLAKVGLESAFLTRNFHELSGGQKQRVIIARALCIDPDILIFDEPLNGVDYETKEKVYELLSWLNREQGLTIIFVSHEIHQIIDSCHHVLCLDKTMHTGCHPMDFAKGNIESCSVLHTGSHVVPVHHHHNPEDNCKCH